MHGDKSELFRAYVEGRQKVIFPWSLSIVDCFFVSGAFLKFGDSGSVALSRISANGTQVAPVNIVDAYDLYDIDTEANGLEVVLLHEPSGSACYWDVHERFVLAVGGRGFLELARPYPSDIERHRYIEAMLHLEDIECNESAEAIYEALSATSFAGLT